MVKNSKRPVYSAFAEIYDEVMRDVDYEGWSEHVINLCNRFDIEVHKILDLACGTGSLAIRLARMGYQVTGVDQSRQMLQIARKKIEREHFTIPLQMGK